MRRNLSRPGARAVDDFGREERRFGGDHACHAAIGKAYRAHGIARGEIHPNVLRRLDSCRCKSARIDATLLEIERRLFNQLWFQFSEGSGQQFGHGKARPFVHMLRRWNQDGSVVPQIHFRAGLKLNFMGKLRIHACAGHRDGLQS